MGKGPKTPPATEASKKGSIAERLRDGEDASPEAPDPCRDPQEIAIALDSGQELAVGDPIQIAPGKPPYARSSAGLIGPVVGPAVSRLEMCIGAGLSFAGVVIAVSGGSVTATVQGS
jgi:hypothetical protein